MIRDEFRDHYNEMKRTKLEEIATDCATAIAVITPRILAPESAWGRRSQHGRDQHPTRHRVADAS